MKYEHGMKNGKRIMIVLQMPLRTQKPVLQIEPKICTNRQMKFNRL